MTFYVKEVDGDVEKQIASAATLPALIVELEEIEGKELGEVKEESEAKEEGSEEAE